MSTHVKRLVRPESVGALDFRNRLPELFPERDLWLPFDRNLHATILVDDENTVSFEEAAAALRDEPTTSSESFAVNVIDVQAYGSNRPGGKEAIALILQNDERFTEDRKYYSGILGHETLRRFNPHVTLARATHSSWKETRQIINWVEERSPATISLARVGIKLSLDKTSQSLTQAS